MKLLELDLKSFGPFTDSPPLDFSENKIGFHIIYGNNEAGKSSTLRALKALLYGIPGRSNDNFIHDNKSLRIGGRVRHSDGTELQFIRRKGTKNTLLNIEDQPLGDTVLGMYLAGVNENQFSNVFGIDHDELVRGSNEIIQGKGDVGESIFSAGLGGPGLRQMLTGLDEEIKKLFLKSGRNQIINKAIIELKSTKSEVSKLSLHGRKWLDLEKEISQIELARKLEQKNKVNLETKHRRLERIQNASPIIAKRKNLLDRLEEMGDVVRLSPEFSDQRKSAQQSLRAAQNSEKRSLENLDKLKSKMELLSILPELIELESIITEFYRGLEVYIRDNNDQIDLISEKRHIDSEIKMLISDLPGELNIEQIQATHPNAAHRARIQELSLSYQEIVSNKERDDKDLNDCNQEFQECKIELDSFDQVRDPIELRQMTTQVRKSGDIETERNQGLILLKTANEQGEVELSQLGLWTGSMDELEMLTIPLDETINRFESEFQTQQAKSNAIQDSIIEIESKISEYNQKIKALKEAGDVPSEGELLILRNKRDQGWQLIRSSWLDKKEVSEDEKEYDNFDTLPVAYEKNVVKADDSSDRLRLDADRVAQSAELTTQIERLKKELISYLEEQAKSNANNDEIRQNWDSLWNKIEIKPLTPREMRTWILNQKELVRNISDRRNDANKLEALSKQIEDSCIKLSSHLERLCEPPADKSESLNDLLNRCDNIVNGIDTTNKKRNDLKVNIKNLGSKQNKLRRSLTISGDKLSSWKNDWGIAISALSLPINTLVGEATAILNKREQLFEKIANSNKLSERINGITSRSDQFSEKVNTFVEQNLPDLTNFSVIEKVSKMHDRLTKSLKDDIEKQGLEKQINEENDRAHESKLAVRNENENINGLCMQAGCSTSEELESIELHTAKYKELESDIVNAEENLYSLSGGSTIESLVKEVSEIEPDTLPSMLSDVTSQLSDLADINDRLNQSIGNLRNELDVISRSEDALDAEQRAQGILAKLQTNVNEFVRLKMASIILHREIESYREKNQGPILRRASELFSQLTLKSFTGLKADFSGQSDDQVLVGVRNDDARVFVEGMSDGTRDQLYISLRIASIEKYLESSEPMPFIVDDILIRFDDLRAKATLKVLAELSQKTQVLLFTHHNRLVELVKEIEVEGNVKIHNL